MRRKVCKSEVMRNALSRSLSRILGKKHWAPAITRLRVWEIGAKTTLHYIGQGNTPRSQPSLISSHALPQLTDIQ